MPGCDEGLVIIDREVVQDSCYWLLLYSCPIGRGICDTGEKKNKWSTAEQADQSRLMREAAIVLLETEYWTELLIKYKHWEEFHNTLPTENF